MGAKLRSRCVKPPIIYGDIFRPEAITVETTLCPVAHRPPHEGHAHRPGHHAAVVFVRDDQPRSTTALQLALAIREEVQDLEKAGIRVVQIDEPAFREGLPLLHSQWQQYLDWAVQAFRISAAGVRNDTQIHTHVLFRVQ